MAYPVSFGIDLGEEFTGLAADLRAILVDNDGVNVGSEFSGARESIPGKGRYMMPISVPDDHIGGIKVYVDGVPGDILTDAPISPPFSPSKITNLPDDTAAVLDDLGTEIALVRAKTDNLPIDPAATSDLVMTSAGLYAVTMQVYRTGTTTPISDVEILVMLDGVMVTRGTTTIPGTLERALDPGVYSLYMQKTGVAFDIQEITVTDDSEGEVFELFGDEATVVPVVPAGMCEIYENIRIQNSNEIPALAKATAAIIKLPMNSSGALLSGQSVQATYDKTEGKIKWVIDHGAFVRFTLPRDYAASGEATVPVATTVRLADLLGID